MVQVDMRNEALLRALLTQVSGQGPGVDSLDADDVGGFEIFLQHRLAAPIARKAAGFFHHEPFGPNSPGLGIFRRDTVVADMGTGHGDDLSAIGGVGQDFLVPGHGRVEHDLPARFPGRAEGPSFEYRSVGQGQDGFLHARSFIR